MAKQIKISNNQKSPRKEAPRMIREHRGYAIEYSNGKYIARPTDGDDLEIFSNCLPRLLFMIDALWDGLAQVPAIAPDEIAGPRVVREWLASPTSVIDVDDAYRRGAC
ncbi:hypothetical protein [Bradyrhizobium sp. URHC0002]